jgi:hypothetical protein
MTENADPQPLYKVLDTGGRLYHGGTGKWTTRSVPVGVIVHPAEQSAEGAESR